jgi:hypothetical protein
MLVHEKANIQNVFKMGKGWRIPCRELRDDFATWAMS